MSKNLLNKAEKLRRSGDYENAAGMYRRFLAKSNIEFSDKLDTLLGLADSLRILGKFEESRKKYLTAAKLLRNSDSTETDTDTYLLDCLIGDALCDKCEGKYKPALSKLEKIKKIAENQKDAAALGFIFWHTGMIYRFLGELDVSKKYLGLSLKAHKKIKDSNGVGFSLCGLGGSSRASGGIGDSLKYYARANKIFKKNHDAYGLAYSFCGMANAYKAMDRIKEAIFNYANAEPLYVKTKDLSSLAFVYKGLAGCYAKTGCDVLSDFYFKKSLKLFKKSRDVRGLLSFYLEKLSKKYDADLYEKAKTAAKAEHLQSEVEYLKKYDKTAPQKWLG